MINEFKKIKATQKEMREFGLLVGFIFAALGALLIWKGREPGGIFAGVGLVLMMLGGVVPRWLKPLYFAWMFLAILLGWVMSRVLLTVIFYTTVTPLAVLMRLKGKDLLDQKYPDSRDTFWRPRHEKWTKEKLEKQF